MSQPSGVFADILGQAPAVETLVRALETGRAHHAYRFEGPEGVGKERAAFAFAQSLVCEASTTIGCGDCAACRRAVHLSDGDPAVPRHPDVVLLERGLYPPSALGTQSRETVAIGVEQIRKIVLSRVGFAPHEGRALVFIVRSAHELSVQAANALLKTLEEPGPRVHFVLVTSQPRRLLDTIRSRTLAVRFGPLPEPVIESILEKHGKPASVAAMAGGSASQALALADDDSARSRDDFLNGALEALAAPDLGAGVVFAGSRPDQRDALRRNLTELGLHFASDAKASVHQDPSRSDLSVLRYFVVEKALTAIERNAQPALLLEAMVAELRNPHRAAR